jgi:hypothetical protein
MEAAYRAGWSACMAWSDRQPPASLSADDAAAWLDGFDDALDAPIGSGPGAADLMRACPVFKTIINGVG